MYPLLDSLIDAPACRGLGQHKRQLSAVKRRQRQQIHDRQVDADAAKATTAQISEVPTTSTPVLTTPIVLDMLVLAGRPLPRRRPVSRPMMDQAVSDIRSWQ